MKSFHKWHVYACYISQIKVNFSIFYSRFIIFLIHNSFNRWLFSLLSYILYFIYIYIYILQYNLKIMKMAPELKE